MTGYERAAIALVGVLAITFALPLLGTTPSSASGYENCSKAPKAQWKSMAEAEAAAKAAGYEVRRSKIDGTCYEVYGVKDGSLYELFYDPATMKHVHTIKKR